MPKIDFIWNITLVCPWDCQFCCTDAAHVSSKSGITTLRENNLSEEIKIQRNLSELFKEKYPNIPCSKYDLALIDRQLRGIEPSFEQKIEILKNLSGLDLKIDFAGGEPLACHENVLVIKAASELFGKESISVTSTGIISKAHSILELARIIGEYEFTYDEPKLSSNTCRPAGYNNSNLKIAEQFSAAGVHTKAQLPIHRENANKLAADNIYRNLCKSNISELLIMRTFPVGRGIRYLQKNEITKKEIIQAINNFIEIENKSKTRIRLQCALKGLDKVNLESNNPCDLMRSSFGINFKGDLLVSAWANDSNGLPLSNDFLLGNLCNTSFEEISNTEKFQKYRKRLDENFGHCKIFAYTHSETKSEDALFSKSDPLFTSNPDTTKNKLISLKEVEF